MTNSIISLCQFVASRAIKSISNGLYFIFKRKAITANFVTYAHTRRHIPHSPRYNILIHPHFLYFIRFSVRTPCVCVCLFISSILHLFNLFIESITCCDSLNFPHARVYTLSCQQTAFSCIDGCETNTHELIHCFHVNQKLVQE